MTFFFSPSPEEYLSMMFDVCRTEDGKASVGLFLEVSSCLFVFAKFFDPLLGHKKNHLICCTTINKSPVTGAGEDRHPPHGPSPLQHDADAEGAEAARAGPRGGPQAGGGHLQDGAQRERRAHHQGAAEPDDHTGVRGILREHRQDIRGGGSMASFCFIGIEAIGFLTTYIPYLL